MENQNQQFDIRDYQPTGKERDFENALRPLQFGDFSGQDKVVDNLRIFVKAARLRAEALDHVLLHGPPGLGKTTRATWRVCLPALNQTTCFSSMRFTASALW